MKSLRHQLRPTLTVAALLVMPLLAASRALAQVDVTATAGTLNASATTLKGAFDAIASTDLAITNTDGALTATPGGNTTYTIIASNAGPSDTTGTVADTFPTSLTCNWTCAGAGGGFCTASGSGSISDAVTLPAGGSVTYTAACTISAAATGTLSNTATVTGAATDPNAGNNSDTDDDTLVPSADIAVTMSVNNSSPGISTTVNFTITATNNGPSNAAGVAVNDFLPGGLMFLEAVLPPGNYYNNSTGWWTIGALANGATATLTLTALVLRLESQVNQATTVGQAQGDGRGSNNTAAVRLNGAPLIDIQVTESVNNSAPAMSTNVIYLVTAKNAGSVPANGVVLTSNLPSGLAFAGSTPSQGSYIAGTGTWNVGTLAANASATLSLTMTYTVNTPVTQTFTKTASTEEDLIAGNDAASVTLNPAGAEADLALTNSDTSEPVPLAGFFVYEIVVTNLGPGGATGVVMTDTLPAGVSLHWAIANQGLCSGLTTVTCNLGAMPAGTSAVIDLRVEKTVGGSVQNSATVAGNEADPNANNNSNVTQTTPVTLIDVSVE